MTDNTKLILRISVSAIVIIVIVVVGIATANRGQAPAAHLVTMDGGEIAVIELWDNYQTRGTLTGRAHDGEVVRLLDQEGAGCQVETDAGERGWVSCADFIMEFK